MSKREYIAFWGAKPSKLINKESFSNFFETHFTLTIKSGSYHFNCVEQFFMWYKAKKFKDQEIADKILMSNYNPKEVKRLGRQVKNYNDKEWDAVRASVMRTGLRLKFTQNEALKELLLSTGDKILVEASPYDRIWGAGIRENDSRISDPEKWPGKNLLGQLLMELREELRKEG